MPFRQTGCAWSGTRCTSSCRQAACAQPSYAASWSTTCGQSTTTFSCSAAPDLCARAVATDRRSGDATLHHRDCARGGVRRLRGQKDAWQPPETLPARHGTGRR
eukprot:7377138-Prymnesium_polylepis.3